MAAGGPASRHPQRAGDGLLTADAIARHTGGRLIGDPGVAVGAVAALDRAEPRDLSFLASARYGGALRSSRAGVVLISPDLAGLEGPEVRARVVTPNPYEALQTLLPRLYPPAPRPTGVHSTARFDRDVRLGDGVAVGAYAVIGEGADLGDGVVVGVGAVIGAGVRIGAGSVLHSGATLYPGTELGERVIIHSGARIGCDGFGYVQRAGAHERIPHVGRCIIEDNVEIGANTTIDRGSIDDTVVGAGTKIDNLVQVAHNVRIGRRCLLMSQVGLAGSVHIEDDCILAGQVGIAGHLTVGRGARLAAQAGVICDIPAGESWSGYPARPHRESLRASAALFKLSSLMARLERLLADRG